MTKDEILAALPKLKQADLEAVHALAGHLLGLVPANAAQGGGPAFDALVTALGLSMAYQTLMGTKAGQIFNKRVPELVKYLDSHFAGWDDNKLSQLAFLQFLYGLIITDLKERNVTASVGMVISNMSRIPELLENAFPGYLRSGMGEVILRQFS